VAASTDVSIVWASLSAVGAGLRSLDVRLRRPTICADAPPACLPLAH
jgi:hypothetical protein